jgi:hypothetical protein
LIDLPSWFSASTLNNLKAAKTPPTLLLEQQYYLEPSVVVDEGDPVAVALWSRDGHRARHIGVNEIERSGSAMAGRREGSRMHFASEAWLADRIALRGQ